MKKSIICLTITVFLFANAIPAQNNWTLKAPSSHPQGLASHSMTWIGDDKILLFGGLKTDFSFSDETWVYDISDDNWTPLSPPIHPVARINASMSTLEADKILLYGGLSDFSTQLNDTWVYDLSENTWTLKSPATNPGPCAQRTAAHLSEDKVLLFTGTTWIYDLSDNNWTQQFPANSQLSVYDGGALAKIGNGKVLWCGMAYTEPEITFETWLYDQATNNWINKTPPHGIDFSVLHRTSSLGGDKVLLYGGAPIEPEGTWIYDLSDNAWSLMPAAPNPGFCVLPGMGSVGNRVVLFGPADPPTATWLFTGDVTCAMEASAGTDEHLLFGYPPSQCKTKTAVVTNGTAPFTYSWTLNRALLPGETMTGANTASVTVCLMDTAELCLTVTDAASCSANDCATIFAEDVRCTSGNNQKVRICHNGNTICVEQTAVAGHLGHGDYIGNCNTITNPGSMGSENNGGLRFNVFPNPSTGDVRITLDPANNERRIRIIDMTGRVVKEITARQSLNVHLDLPGTYIVQLFNGKNIQTRKLLIVQ